MMGKGEQPGEALSEPERTAGGPVPEPAGTPTPERGVSGWEADGPSSLESAPAPAAEGCGDESASAPLALPGAEGWPERTPEEADPGGVLESVLFAARRPLDLKDIRRALRTALAGLEQEGTAIPADAPVRRFAELDRRELEQALLDLAAAYRADPRRGFLLVQVADGYQLVSKPEYAPWLRPLAEERRRNLLSRPALETLAVIAYRQPVTRADVEQVRGVSVDGVLRTLLERGLVRMAGRSDQPGRPMLYETTRLFLEHFGLRTVRDLPAYHELSRAPAREAARQAEWLGGAQGGVGPETPAPAAAGLPPAPVPAGDRGSVRPPPAAAEMEGSANDAGESAPRD